MPCWATMTKHLDKHTIRGNVTSLDQLRGADGEFLAGTVDVTGSVFLHNMKLERLPVRFGTVDRSFWCDGNQLISLVGVPHSIEKRFSCSYNRLTSMVGVHQILKRVGGSLYINGNKIKSGGIGLVLVEGLTKIYAEHEHPAFEIIEKYLGQGKKGLLRCQEALYEAGYGEFARL